MTLTQEVRARLDAHLDAVEKALLAAGNSRERRRGVVDDLEAQIQEMLAGKSAAPTVADLEEVLAKLDPPAAYGEAAGRAAAGNVPPAQPQGTPAGAAGAAAAPTAAGVFQKPFAQVYGKQPRYSRTAIWGLVCILLSLVPIPLLMVGALLFARHAMVPEPVRVSQPLPGMGGPEMPGPGVVGSAPAWTGVGLLGLGTFVLMGPLALAGTVLGWVAFGQIRGSGGMIRGTGMALFDGLFYPVLFVISSVITPFFLPIVGLALLAMSIAVVWIVIRLATGKRVMG